MERRTLRAPQCAILFLALAALPISLNAQSSQPASGQSAPAAQASVRASGTVLTPGKVPVAGATVRLTHVESGQAWVTWTDENGKFELRGVPAGHYRVEASQLGFDAGVRETEWKADTTAPVDIALKVIAHPPSTAVAQAPAKAEEATPPKANVPAPAPKQTETPPAAASGAVPGGPAQQGQQQTSRTAPPQGAPPQGARPGQPGAQGPTGPNGQRMTPQQIQQMIEAARQRAGGGGFQQVDPLSTAGGSGANGAAGAGMPGGASIESNPLGDASSSDAFLLNGTVGRGATAGGTQDFSLMAGMFGMLAGAGGFPGGIGGIEGMAGAGGFPGAGGAPGFPGAGGVGGMQVMIMGPGGPGGGQQQRGGQQQGRAGQQARGQAQQGRGGQAQGQAGQARGGQAGPGNVGPVNIQAGGMEALWGMQRMLRLAANRVRFGFYNRYGHSALDAKQYALTATPSTKIPVFRENFGVNLGGPLTIPKVYNGKDKTFIFLNYDLSRNQSPVDVFSTVPTLEERNGDFSARGLQLFDPQSNLTGPRTAFGSVIPAGRLDAAAQGLLAFVPLPNLPGFVQNYHLQTRVPQHTDRGNVRLIHTINQKLNMQVTYGVSSTRGKSISSFQSLRGESSSLGQNLGIGLTQQWTQRLTHDTRLNWSRNSIDSLNQYAFSNDIAGKLGIIGISTDPVNFGVPSINYTNFTDLNDPVPAFRHNQTLLFSDTLSWTHRKHTVRGGMTLRRQQLNTRNDPVARGQFTFTGLMTSQLDAQGRPLPNTGYDFADFLLGLPQSTTVRFGNSSTYLRGWGLSIFAQDDWRLHPRFSLTLGLRYEVAWPFTEKYGKLANLTIDNAITQAVVVVPGGASPLQGSLPDALIRTDYNNFGPRIAIAWRPNLKAKWPKNMVVRAGYSLFYNTSILNQLAASMSNQPPHAQAQTRLTSSAQVLTLVNGFPPVTPGDVPNTIGVDPNYRVGYAQIWNFGVEAQVAPQVVLDVTYTGTKGTHLDLLRSPNRSLPTDPLATEFARRIPNAPGFTYDTFGASSIYHAMQLRLQRRFNRGLMLMGTYNYGKSIDNASSIGGGAQVVVQDDNNFRAERGLSSFDIRHQIRGFWMYELPFGERKRFAKTGTASKILGSWTFNGNWVWTTGTPFTARLLGNAANNSGTGNNLFSERPDAVGDPNRNAPHQALNWFNGAAFTQPAPGLFGNAGRNTIEGPGQIAFNVGLGKNIRLGKDGQRRLDLRWDANNIFNHPNFTGLNTALGSTNYGRVSGTRTMRTMEFTARFNF